MPVLEAQQGVDAVVVRLRAGRVQAALQLLEERVVEGVRAVAPGLVDRVGHDRVADHAAREGVAVGDLLPFAAQVPVVGDVVVVEDHRHRDVRQHAPHRRQVGDEGLECLLLAGVEGRVLCVQPGRRVEFEPAPGGGRPHQQVHRQHFGERDQVVVRAGRGEHRLLHASEEDLDQRVIALVLRQQLVAPVVAVGVAVEAFGVAHAGLVDAFESLHRQAEAADQAVDGAQHRAGDVVGVDLVAGHHQRGRPRRQAVGFRGGVGVERVARDQLGEQGIGAH